VIMETLGIDARGAPQWNRSEGLGHLTGLAQVAMALVIEFLLARDERIPMPASIVIGEIKNTIDSEGNVKTERILNTKIV